MPYEITHSGPDSGHFPAFTPPKLVLDLAIQEGRMAELTWVVIISQDCLTAKYAHLSQK